MIPAPIHGPHSTLGRLAGPDTDLETLSGHNWHDEASSGSSTGWRHMLTRRSSLTQVPMAENRHLGLAIWKLKYAT